MGVVMRSPCHRCGRQKPHEEVFRHEGICQACRDEIYGVCHLGGEKVKSLLPSQPTSKAERDAARERISPTPRTEDEVEGMARSSGDAWRGLSMATMDPSLQDELRERVPCRFHGPHCPHVNWPVCERCRKHTEDLVEHGQRAHGDQPPPQPNDGPHVADLVLADMQERKRIGREHYRVPPGRDALRNAYEEALDLCVYLRQAIAERDRR